MTPNKKLKIKQELKMNKCRFCLSTENLTIDHVIPKSKGGTDDIKNLQCLCKRCNTMKSSFTNGQLRSIWRWGEHINQEREASGKGRMFKKSFPQVHV